MVKRKRAKSDNDDNRKGKTIKMKEDQRTGPKEEEANDGDNKTDRRTETRAVGEMDQEEKKTLIIAIKSMLPESDKIKYSTTLSKMDWSTVAIAFGGKTH